MSGCVCCCGALLRLRASVVAVSVVVLVAAAADVAVFTAVVNATDFPTSYSTDPRCWLGNAAVVLYCSSLLES